MMGELFCKVKYFHEVLTQKYLYFFWETRNECSWPLSVLSVFRFMLSTVTNFVKYRPNLFQIQWIEGRMWKQAHVCCSQQYLAFIID